MLDSIRWDSDLIRRYDQAGPRYTSYPTAAQFNDKVGSFDLLHALRSIASVTPVVFVRPSALLRQRLLLLRLQQDHHQGPRPGAALSGAHGKEIELISCHGQGPAGRATALRWRHADLPKP